VSTRQILGTVGAAVGAYFFGPQGAQWGWVIGSAIGGAIDPEIIKGPSVGDIAAQTSQEGIPRPIVFALSPPMAGNIIASGEPRIVRRRESQGKGGPKVETESVYRTYAIGVCEGPITRFVRVWRNNQLVYDAENEAMGGDIPFDFLGQHHTTPGENGQFLNTGRFFLGGWDQDPSPDLEIVFGVGLTPSHRGTAYMVMADEDLTDLRGAIPQFQFQVERCEGFFLTSRPYALEHIDAVGSDHAEPDDSRLMELMIEGMQSEHVQPRFGEIFGGLVEYEDAEPEGMESLHVEPLFGDIFGGLVTYEDAEPEGVESGLVEPLFGELFGDLVEYENWPPEGIDSLLTPLDGTLE
jgi:hypothetical protein